MDRNTLIADLKRNIIKSLNLPDVSPEDIGDDLPLFEAEGLGLDSVDALELVVMAERDYGVSIDDKDEAKTIFGSVSSLADYVIARRK